MTVFFLIVCFDIRVFLCFCLFFWTLCVFRRSVFGARWKIFRAKALTRESISLADLLRERNLQISFTA